MTDLDIDELFRRFAILDAELKEIRRELAEVKQQSCSTAWSQKYVTPYSFSDHLHIGKRDEN